MVRESATPVYEICRLPESTDMTCRPDAASRRRLKTTIAPAGAGAIVCLLCAIRDSNPEPAD